jgi:hypothetical protein
LLRAGIAIGLILVTAFFTAAEAALGAARRARIEALAHGGNRRARLAERAIQRLDSYAAGARAGVTLATLGLGWIGMSASSPRSWTAPCAACACRWIPSPYGPPPPSSPSSWWHGSTWSSASSCPLLARLNPEGVTLWTVAPLML